MERRKFTREFKLEAVRLIKDRGVSYVQAAQDLSVHVSQLRDWVKKFSDDPQQAFPGHDQMKPEQLEIAPLYAWLTRPRSQRSRDNQALGGEGFSRRVVGWSMSADVSTAITSGSRIYHRESPGCAPCSGPFFLFLAADFAPLP